MTPPTLSPPPGLVNAGRIAEAIRQHPGRTTSELAADLGLDRRTVDRHAARLEATGAVHRIRGAGRVERGGRRVAWLPGPAPGTPAPDSRPVKVDGPDSPPAPASDGDRLRHLRERRGLNQAEAARRAGTSRARLADAEAGRAVPRWDTVLRWAHAWGCTRDDLAATILAGLPE